MARIRLFGFFVSTYRSDIDGLRAVAILPVVLFHASIPGFSGGFVGVDVFFVISGFLITSIIRTEIQQTRFTLTGFYERRARRILPAFFAMMLACLGLATWTLYPHQFLAFSRSVIAASLFVSSFLFRSEEGYFDLESEQKPLLHTWSLSVEEIFYIVFPLLLLTLRHRQQKTQIRVLTGIAILSLTASAIALAQDPNSQSAFFLPYSRAWELLLGALLAYRFLPNPNPRLRDLASLIGLAMILLAVVRYSKETVFPGISALLPCLGAALVIHAGQQGSSLGGRLLSTPILVFIGQISYALYLWHWPLLVFARIRYAEPLPAWLIVAILALSFLLAVLSTRFLEQPIRRSKLISRRQVLITSALGLFTLVAIGSVGIASQGWSGRYPPEVARILFAEQDRDPRQDDCLTSGNAAAGCLYGQPSSLSKVALWGDSHAAVYAVMLGELAAAQDQSIHVFTMPSCPPLDGWALPVQSWRGNCLDFQDLTMQQLLNSSSIHSVLLSARFAGYPIAEPESGFEAKLHATIRRLQAVGKRVFLIGPVPELGEHVPLALSQALLAGKPVDDLWQPIETFRQNLGFVFTLLDTAQAATAADILKPHQQLCERGRCFFYRDGVVNYYDEHHLSLTGAALLMPLFAPVFTPPTPAHEAIERPPQP